MTTSHEKIAKFNRTNDSGERLYTAMIERIIYDDRGLSLPVIDSTFNGKPTVKYGLTMQEAVNYLNGFPIQGNVKFN